MGKGVSKDVDSLLAKQELYEKVKLWIHQVGGYEIARAIAIRNGFTAQQFNNWATGKGGMPRNRVLKFLCSVTGYGKDYDITTFANKRIIVDDEEVLITKIEPEPYYLVKFSNGKFVRMPKSELDEQLSKSR